jgi:peroxiredoxin
MGSETNPMADSNKKSGSKKQVVFLWIMVLAVVLLVVGYIALNKQEGNKIIVSGDRAPEFRLSALDGRSVNLSDLRGKVVMVHFWATWCPPCVEEIPTLAKLYPQFAGADFEMLAVSVDEGGANAVSAFMLKNNLQVPVLLDPDRATANHYGTFKFPETYIVDRKGVVRYKMIGPRNWMDPESIQILKSIIAS